MKRHLPAIASALLLLIGCGWSPAARAQAAPESEPAAESLPEQPPNIVFILADDLGIECLSAFGGTSHETPNIDRLAAQGMRFTHCFSNPYCSPSRAELLTGRYPFQNGVTRVIYDAEQHANIYLHTDQPSFARQLHEAGYATAIAGKWHVSFLYQHNDINAFGFDQYQCWQIFRDDATRTSRFHNPHFIRNGTIIEDEIADRYGPEVNAQFLIDFINTNAQSNTPFLAYYTCLLPHFPWEPTPDSEDQDYVVPNNSVKGDPRYFPDMVRYLDYNVGRLMDTLDEAGVADNTVFIFLADNGADRDLRNLWGADDLVVHGGKGTMTDLGTHVPLLVRWPGHIEAGAVCDDLIDFVDFLPTLCAVADAPLPEQSIHGYSFLPQLLGRPAQPRQWVHVQNIEDRHIRSMSYILNNHNELRPVVGIGQPQARVIANDRTDEQRAARQQLQAILDHLGP